MSSTADIIDFATRAKRKSPASAPIDQVRDEGNAKAGPADIVFPLRSIPKWVPAGD